MAASFGLARRWGAQAEAGRTHASVASGMLRISRTLTIPDSKAGIIIGRRGNVIRNVQEMTGAKVVVDNDAAPDESQPNVQVRKVRISDPANMGSSPSTKVIAAETILTKIANGSMDTKLITGGQP